jgi:hypothetical protein
MGIHEVCRATLLHQVASTKVQERRRLETISEIWHPEIARHRDGQENQNK